MDEEKEIVPGELHSRCGGPWVCVNGYLFMNSIEDYYSAGSVFWAFCLNWIFFPGSR